MLPHQLQSLKGANAIKFVLADEQKLKQMCGPYWLLRFIL
jgi:hypothetical protein